MIGIGLRRAAAVGGGTLVLIAALVGCGRIATNDRVEEQIKSQLGTDSADCPEDLPGEVGRSIICTATAGDAKFGVRVTVTSVEGNTINFDIERVDGAPATPVATPTALATADAPMVAGRTVAQSVLDQLASSGRTVDQVTCPDLPARIGATERCSLTTGAETYGVTVTVTSVQGSDVKFDIQVDAAPQ